ncbi:glycosyltransferase family 8 protein [Kaistia defluvii]|uniref:Lipopolysaccharide biosynthesis glycosyltransferase n=1 Tax=Kaistia defluvii TaxID=410841 RepID=A0ABV2QWE8_9HYPH
MIIVSASDDNFVPGLLNLLYSTLFHNKDAEFYIIDAGLSAASIDLIARFSSRNNIRSQILLADKSHLASLPKNPYWTSAMYARLLIPQLLPQHDRAIYIDADATVISDLSELWSMPLDGNLLAGVLDGSVHQSELDHVKIGNDRYINSGVLVFDLAQWRKENTAQKVVEYLLANTELIFPDQSAINAVVQGRVKFLDRRWNFFSWNYKAIPGIIPAIVHYTGNNKPWQKRRAPLAAIYEAYRKLSGSDFPRPRDLPEFTKARRTVVGLLSLRPKHWKIVYYTARARSQFTTPHVREIMARASQGNESPREPRPCSD